MNRIAYESIPKIELHRHLEGNFSPCVLYKMAQKNHLNFPHNYDDFVAQLQFPKDLPPDFFLFLSKFYNNWYKSLDDVYEVVHTSMLELGLHDNLLYLELRFNPLHYALHCGFDPVDSLKTVLSALRDAVRKRGLFVRYLITFNRAFHPQDNMIALLKRFQKEVDLTDVVGLDLAGDEVQYPPQLFTNFCQYAHSQGFKLTLHAGEVTGPEQVRYCIEKNYATRIGHGVSAIRDEDLCAVLKEKGIVLEMCPLSNYQTGAWPETAQHPLKKLLRLGVPVTLNSDDPTVQNSTLCDDYRLAHEQMGLSLADFDQMNHYAIAGSFLPKPQQQDLLQKYLTATGR